MIFEMICGVIIFGIGYLVGHHHATQTALKTIKLSKQLNHDYKENTNV